MADTNISNNVSEVEEDLDDQSSSDLSDPGSEFDFYDPFEENAMIRELDASLRNTSSENNRMVGGGESGGNGLQNTQRRMNNRQATVEDDQVEMDGQASAAGLDQPQARADGSRRRFDDTIIVPSNHHLGTHFEFENIIPKGSYLNIENGERVDRPPVDIPVIVCHPSRLSAMRNIRHESTEVYDFYDKTWVRVNRKLYKGLYRANKRKAQILEYEKTEIRYLKRQERLRQLIEIYDKEIKGGNKCDKEFLDQIYERLAVHEKFDTKEKAFLSKERPLKYILEHRKSMGGDYTRWILYHYWRRGDRGLRTLAFRVDTLQAEIMQLSYHNMNNQSLWRDMKRFHLMVKKIRNERGLSAVVPVKTDKEWREFYEEEFKNLDARGAKL